MNYGITENIKKGKILGEGFFYYIYIYIFSFFAGGSSKKLPLQEGGGHVKKIGKVGGGVMQFLNGAS